MLYIVLITSLLSIVFTFYYTFVVPNNEKTPKKQVFQFVMGSFTIVLILFYPFIINLPSIINTFWAQIGYFPIYIVITVSMGLSRRITLQNGRDLISGLYVSKIIIFIVFLPMMLLYILRRLPMEDIQFYTILITVISLIVFVLYSIAIRSKYGNYVAYFNFFTVGLLVLLTIVIQKDSLQTTITKIVGERVFEQVYYMDVDYIPTSVVSFRDTNFRYRDEQFFSYVQVYDMEWTVNELYYVIYDYTSISLSVYSFDTEETTVISTYVVPDEMGVFKRRIMRYNTLERVGDTIYYANLDGLFTLDGTTMTLENTMSIEDLTLFDGVDKLSYIAYQLEENMYDIYRLNETDIEFVEQIDYSSDTKRYDISINTGRLYIEDQDDMEVTIYGGKTFVIPQIEKTYRIDLITPDHIIYGEYALNDNSKDYNYIVDSSGDVNKVEPLDFNFYSVIKDENGLYYYAEDYHRSSNPIVYLYNEYWEKQSRIKLRVLDDTIEIEDDVYIMRYTEEKVYYMTLSGTDNHYKIELNQLERIESTLEFTYFDYMNGLTSFVYMMILIIPSTNGRRKRNKDTIKQDNYEEKGMNFDAIEDKEDETTLW